MVGSLDAVEKGKDRRSLLGGLSDRRSDRIERITFDAEDREVCGAELVGAICGRDLHHRRSLTRSDLQATTADRGQILAARVERDIVSRPRQLPAVIGADRAGAEHYDFQGSVIVALGVLRPRERGAISYQKPNGGCSHYYREGK